MEAIDQIKSIIAVKRSFVLEAGAGAGKTYALIQTINHLLELEGKNLLFNHQRIVCITYTNVAKNEIIERLENNPLVSVSTIHEFIWDCIKPFNKQLIIQFDHINTIKHAEKPDKYELGLAKRITRVEYTDSVFSDFEEGIVGHNDLITLTEKMFSNYDLLTSIIAEKYPIILVDEYQDTAPEVISTLLDSILSRNQKNLIIGFYGDSHQKIYDEGVGSLEKYVDNGSIELVKKEENYRSSKEVRNLLNNIRTNIKQVLPKDKEDVLGCICFVNCTNYPERSTGQSITQYEKSIIPLKNENYDRTIEELKNKGWHFGTGSPDKVLIMSKQSGRQ